MKSIYENQWLSIEVEPAEIPWLKLFVKAEGDAPKEMSDCDAATRQEIYRCLHIIELEMRAYFQPTKINIASFANYLPVVHWHIMARYEQDSYYPEPVWGKKQREASLDLPSMDDFIAILSYKL
ncbi:MAG TPA: HIT family protein [Thiotrichaceae bacterium]|nr:HIT family protein [Thiotrichaceae bacterium]